MTGRITALEDAAETLDARREAVAEHGESDLRDLRDAVREVESLLDRHEEDATGYGDFEAYVEFQDDLVETVEDLPADLPRREDFEALLDLFKKQTLSGSDFAAARDRLADARDLVERLEALEDARDRYRSARGAVADRAAELDDEVARLERLQHLGEADLDAPTGRLREPFAAYNETVRDAFDAFRETAPARDVLGLVEDARAFPLVGFEAPPSPLVSFIASRDVGEEPVPTLLEYAEYSRSKLAHYVDDPSGLKRAVGGNRTYLTRLSAAPLTLDWPPRPAGVLRYRTAELVSVVGRFADDPVVARLHDVRGALRDDGYDRLRAAAVANAELADGERERIESGGVAEDLAAARDERERLREALEAHPALTS